MPNGGTLIAGAGRGPKKGAPNAGRPPDEWKRALQALADRQEVLAHIDRSLLEGPRRPLLNAEGKPIDLDGLPLPDRSEPIYVGSTFFENALTYVTEHGYGRATQPVAHSGSVALLPAAERDARAKALLDRLGGGA
jgi:hypothetical protein